MKKFLFTLAALLMAGSLCAEEYFYIEDFEVSQELLAQTAARNRRMTIPVKAHFDAYVNAFQVDLSSTADDEGLNQLPGGVTIYSATDGPGMTVPYMNDMCEDVEAVLNIGKAQNNTRIIGTVGVVAGYWFEPGMDPDNDDPVSYGSIKWIGDYECMFNLVFQFPQDFTGCDIWVKTQPASGKDTRGPITDGTKSYHKFTISVEGSAPVPADKPVITVLNDNTTDVTVEITAEEGATVMYQVTEAGAKAYAAYDGPMHFTTPGTYTIEAYAEGPNGKTESEHATETFTVKAPDQPSTPGNVDIVVNPTNYEVTPTGNEAQIIVDGEVVNAPLVIERPAYGQDDINVTVTVRTDDGEGYYPVETPVTFVVKAQLPEPNIVATPGQASEDEGHTNQVDGHYYDVTFEAPAGYTVHYIINGPNGAHFEGNWVAGDDPIHVTADGTYSVEAYTVDGEDRSTSDTDTFVISPKTGVNELMNGKTVASQRFFNLAGQEMTEANGVTIVVTTYTDGTTSAVKVMK